MLGRKMLEYGIPIFGIILCVLTMVSTEISPIEKLGWVVVAQIGMAISYLLEK